jgi:outer membrane receptor protein involved in Fe transport
MKLHVLAGATALMSSMLAPSLAVGQVSAASQTTSTTATPTQQATTNEQGDATDSTGAATLQGEDIIVTGSLVPRPQFEGTIPGVQVTAQQIEARAFTNVLDVLNDIPLVGPGASPFGTNGGQPASLGASFVDLLDLGTNRTLTLVNGRRYVSGNAASLFVAGNVTGSQVDLNTIPAALVERIDVLTVGGAVTYGSDAIAGVVNLVMKQDFEGLRVSGLTGLTDRGDGANYRLTAVAGRNFAGGRGNVTASIEYVRDDALIGTDRAGFRAGFIAPTSFRNGSVRNTGFTPSLSLTATTGAFLPAASDLVPNNIAGRGYTGGTILYSEPGAIFQINANITNFLPTGFQGIATTNPQNPANPNLPNVNSPSFRPSVLINQAGNVNLIPGTPIATGNGCAVSNLTGFCNFAPTALPGTANSAAQNTYVNAVLSRFAPTFATQGTQAQRNALALQLLQANLPTPREYLARNPGTDINAFIGTFIPNFLDVPTVGAQAGIFPATAVPLQFDAAGNVVRVTAATITDPLDTPSTTGGAAGGAGFNSARYTNLRVQQNRYIANLIGHFEIAPALTVYTENQYARVENLSPTNFASRNSIDVASAENATLVMDVANPYLNTASQNTLRAAGVTNKFVVSRTNQDIVGDNPARVNSNTYRSVIGARGSFEGFGRRQQYDVSFSYGRADIKGSSFQIKDIEYALAVDAVRDGNGNIVCRAQLTGSGAAGTTPYGVVGQELVRERGADGVITERLIRRVATPEQVSGCRPLNVFGYNNMSAEARNYVLARTGFTNKSEQYFGNANLGGSFFDLPGGSLGYGLVGQYRREELSYSADELSRTGATRTAALASTSGYIESYEFGGELAIPIFGGDFKFPLLQSLEFNPGVRFVKQDGGAPDVRLLNGSLLNQQSKGDWNSIYSLAGTWKPIPDISLRGNYTRSIRQPSVVELFLGGQPAFTSPTDPCSVANIGTGTVPATRRANCRAAVIGAGLATDAATADSFLNNYVPSGAGITGTFAGSPGLLPEKGRSWTVGGVLAPRFIPGLQFSADYIDVEVRNQIIPTDIVTALQTCFDSPTFPDTAPQVGVNVCSFFNRIPSTAQERRFEVDNGFNSGFINLGSLRVRGINMTGQYTFDLDSLIGSDIGQFSLYANAYHNITYLSAPTGDFSAALQSSGTFGRPKWETQLRGRYENGGFFTQWVWNWQNKTRFFQSGAPVAGTDTQNEVQDFLRFDSFSLHDAAIGYAFGEGQRFAVQFNIRNVFDKQYVGTRAQAFALTTTSTRIDDFGRRFALSANVKF